MESSGIELNELIRVELSQAKPELSQAEPKQTPNFLRSSP